MQVDWDSSTSQLLCNPCYAAADQTRFQQILQAATEWPTHVWLATSGSTNVKWVGLSKQALLASAAAVNHHLASTHADHWIHCLPDFHVGGVGIWARAYLTGARVSDFKLVQPKWEASAFYDYMQEKRGTLTALVPAQLHDLLALKRAVPPHLRAIIIGGGALLPTLYQQAVEVNWPVLPSYGLTECASQVATAPLNSWQTKNYRLEILPHLKIGEREGRLCLAGASLMSVYAFLEQEKVKFVDPKIEGWLFSEDRGVVIQEKYVEIQGRVDAMIKIGGETVDLARLETHLQTLRLQLGLLEEVTLLAWPHTRLGHVLHLAAVAPLQEKLEPLMQQFQSTVLPFERIRHVHLCAQFPRSPLGKIIKSQLITQLMA